MVEWPQLLELRPMPYQDERIYRGGLTAIAEGNIMHLCNAEPATFADLATMTLANKTDPTIDAIADSAGGGRQRTIPTITDLTVTTAATATHWALADTVNSRLLFADALQSDIAVTVGTPATLPSITISIDPPAGVNMNTVFDQGIDILTNQSEAFHLTTALVGAYAEVAGVSLGSKANPTIGVAIARAGDDGFQVPFTSFNDGIVSTPGSATHFVIADNTNSLVLISGPIEAQTLTSDRPFEVSGFTMGVP